MRRILLCAVIFAMVAAEHALAQKPDRHRAVTDSLTRRP